MCHRWTAQRNLSHQSEDRGKPCRQVDGGETGIRLQFFRNAQSAN
jgi:hypothetical protein